jgi:hypothetical protein
MDFNQPLHDSLSPEELLLEQVVKPSPGIGMKEEFVIA